MSAGFLAAERRGVEAELVHLAGPQVLQHDVGLRSMKSSSARALRRVAQLAHHRALVAVDRLERGRRAVEERRPPLARVVAGGLLDLDHLGAEVAEDLPGDGRGDAVAELHDDDAGERKGGRQAHSGLMPAAVTILRKVSMSSFTMRANSSALVPTTGMPAASSLARTSGDCTAFTISALRRLRIGSGSAAGPKNPSQERGMT